MKAAVLTSTSLRHRFFAEQMGRSFDVVSVICQAKKNYYTEVRDQSALVETHFARLAQAERTEFADRVDGRAQAAMQEVADINDPDLVASVRALGAEVILLFGTAILRMPWLDAFPDRIVNLHLGLSPYYRGSATLFWPFTNGELECVGTTIHLATAKVDAGAILARIKARPQVGDSYYSLTNRLIRESIEAMPRVVDNYFDHGLVPIPQVPAEETRAYRKADFDENALRRALDFVGDGLTAEQVMQAERGKRCNCSR